MKTVTIGYQCDRCKKTITRNKSPKLGITIANPYPKEFKSFNGAQLCQSCQQDFWNKFMKEKSHE